MGWLLWILSLGLTMFLIGITKQTYLWMHVLILFAILATIGLWIESAARKIAKELRRSKP